MVVSFFEKPAFFSDESDGASHKCRNITTDPKHTIDQRGQIQEFSRVEKDFCFRILGCCHCLTKLTSPVRIARSHCFLKGPLYS